VSKTLHPAHDDITASIAADLRKFEALCIERGWLRHRADGQLETTVAGVEYLFEQLAKFDAQTRH